MQILALYALIFTLGASSGGVFAYKLQEYRVANMQNAILQQKVEANAVYNALVEANNAQQQAVQQTNNERDISYAQNIQTINTLHEQLSATKLQRPNGWKNCDSAKRDGNSAEVIANSTTAGEFPARLHEFFAPRTFIADQLAQYAKECYNFVVERNCGISGK